MKKESSTRIVGRDVNTGRFVDSTKVTVWPQARAAKDAKRSDTHVRATRSTSTTLNRAMTRLADK
jgi:hypothetical protein